MIRHMELKQLVVKRSMRIVRLKDLVDYIN